MQSSSHRWTESSDQDICLSDSRLICAAHVLFDIQVCYSASITTPCHARVQADLILIDVIPAREIPDRFRQYPNEEWTRAHVLWPSGQVRVVCAESSLASQRCLGTALRDMWTRISSTPAAGIGHIAKRRQRSLQSLSCAITSSSTMACEHAESWSAIDTRFLQFSQEGAPSTLWTGFEGGIVRLMLSKPFGWAQYVHSLSPPRAGSTGERGLRRIVHREVPVAVESSHNQQKRET